jgi:hypothetical protein
MQLPVAVIGGLALVVTGASLRIQSSASSDDVATIRRLEEQRRLAYARFDTTPLAPLLADDYEVGGGGRRLYEHGRDESLRIIPQTRPIHVPIDSITIDSMNVRVYGTTAVVVALQTHWLAPPGAARCRHVDNVMHVWVNRDGWKLVGRHISQIGTAPCPP